MYGRQCILICIFRDYNMLQLQSHCKPRVAELISLQLGAVVARQFEALQILQLDCLQRVESCSGEVDSVRISKTHPVDCYELTLALPSRPYWVLPTELLSTFICQLDLPSLRGSRRTDSHTSTNDIHL